MAIQTPQTTTTIQGILYESLGKDTLRVHYSNDQFVDVPWKQVMQQLQLTGFEKSGS